MSFAAVKDELVIKDNPRLQDIAQVTVQTRLGLHPVLIHWAGMSTGKSKGYLFSPVELTLPRDTREEIDALREFQEGVLRHSVGAVFDPDEQERRNSREHIVFLTREMRTPLICSAIRKGRHLAIWCPRVPGSRETTVNVGEVTNILV